MTTGELLKKETYVLGKPRNQKKPSKEHIEWAVNKANSEGIIIEIEYWVWYQYSVTIRPGETIESVMDKMPKSYGL